MRFSFSKVKVRSLDIIDIVKTSSFALFLTANDKLIIRYNDMKNKAITAL
jgi:uncharacterized secreted protein with C-terminal beta-propeller domain